jgi:hypothetical protein
VAGLPTPDEVRRTAEREAALATRRLGKLCVGAVEEEAPPVKQIEPPSEEELARMSPFVRAVVTAEVVFATDYPTLDQYQPRS